VILPCPREASNLVVGVGHEEAQRHAFIIRALEGGSIVGRGE
jgi:hypothetical protein